MCDLKPDCRNCFHGKIYKARPGTLCTLNDADRYYYHDHVCDQHSFSMVTYNNYLENVKIFKENK